MQVGETSRSLTPNFEAIDRAVPDGLNKPFQRRRFRRPAVEMKKPNDPTQCDFDSWGFDSTDRSARIASATFGNMSRRLG